MLCLILKKKKRKTNLESWYCVIAHLTFFLVLLFSYSTAGNAYSAGRQCGYSVAPVNLCKSLLSAFAEGNLHFQMHEIAIFSHQQSQYEGGEG